MYLSKLELIGFKSFANKTVFKFSEGLTSVVGPNGCGKTNIVDAIRWVLGEQKTSILRSEIMENVLFNGTSTRKPLGMAEVSMTLQNTKQILPIEYSEVTITRRLFRNGESSYLLNNTQCRLKDIVDLFMDTGMGADSYSVIELKMVEDILNGKAEERRNLIEEAAGVKKYKFRRKEAGRKLLSVQGDLVRLQDIIQEIEKNVGTLSRQAAKTRRYNKLSEQLKALELDLLIHEFAELKSGIKSFDNELLKMRDEKAKTESEILQLEEKILELKTSLSLYDKNHTIALAKENDIRSEIARKSKDKAVMQEKIASLESAQERLKKELFDSETTCDRTNKNLDSSRKGFDELSRSFSASTENLDKLKSERDVAQQIVFEKRDKANSTNEELINLQNNFRSVKSQLERNRNRKNGIDGSIAEAKKEIEKINKNIFEIENKRKETTASRDKLSIAISIAEKELKNAQERQQQLQSQMQEHTEQISDNKNTLNRHQAALEFLSGLIDSDETSKFLIKNNDWLPATDKIQLAEAVGADDNFRIAIDAALGEAARYFVVNNRNEALNAISILRNKNKGKATFICLSDVPEASAPSLFPKEDGIFGWASELVRTEETIRQIIRGLLGKTLIVDTHVRALEVVNRGLCDAAVDLSGGIVRSLGIVRGGSVSKTEGISIGKRERIEQLNHQIEDILQRITELENSYNSIKKEYLSIDIRKLSDELRRSETEKNNNEQIISQLIYKKESLEQSFALHEKNSLHFAKEIEDIDNEIEKLESELNDNEGNLIIAKEQQQDSYGKLQEAEDEAAKRENSLRNAEMEQVRLQEEIKSNERDISRLEQQLSGINKRMEDIRSESTHNNSKITEYKSQIITLDSELEKDNLTAAEAQSEREFLAAEITSLQNQIEQYSQTLSQYRKVFEKNSDSIHELDLRMNERRIKLKNILDRAQEGHELDLETSEHILDENFSIKDTKTALQALKEKLGALGNVNFMALEEFEAQSERLKFYNEQIIDLQNSEKNLQETITEINETASQRFLETFGQINKNFKELFIHLFGTEAESELILSEGDPLEANVEIIAKPPGKKPHSIEMLSGGEKTLTAIALLFGIYLVKPSPFCILDEVDAPLDDANIDRYINLLRKFSDNTQFIIVTHNKRTMEASDTLYGITMQEEGISTVVSVRIEQEAV